MTTCKHADSGCNYPEGECLGVCMGSHRAVAMIYITDNTTGESRLHTEDWHDDFIWSEGNFACDCNRALFFARAGGEDDTDKTPCGESRYSVRIVDEAGNLLYEDEPAKATRSASHD